MESPAMRLSVMRDLTDDKPRFLDPKWMNGDCPPAETDDWIRAHFARAENLGDDETQYLLEQIARSDESRLAHLLPQDAPCDLLGACGLAMLERAWRLAELFKRSSNNTSTPASQANWGRVLNLDITPTREMVHLTLDRAEKLLAQGGTAHRLAGLIIGQKKKDQIRLLLGKQQAGGCAGLLIAAIIMGVATACTLVK